MFYNKFKIIFFFNFIVSFFKKIKFIMESIEIYDIVKKLNNCILN